MAATSKGKRSDLAKGLIWVGLLFAVSGLVYQVITPKRFCATATVRVWKNGATQNGSSTAPFNPNTTLPGECELIRSQAVLDPVIQTLALNERWGNRYSHGIPLQTNDTRQRLRLMIDARPLFNSGIISVTVTGQDPAEVAEIANQTAAGYSAYRSLDQTALPGQSLDTLGAQLTELNGKIAAGESNLTRLALSINYDKTTNSLKYLTPAFYEAVESNRTVLWTNLEAQTARVQKVRSLTNREFSAAAAQLDGATNTALPDTLRKLDEASQRLAHLISTAGPLLPEVQQVKAATNELNQIANEEARSLVTAKEAQIAGMQAALDAFTLQLKGVTTNLDEFIALHPDYQRALRDVQHLRTQREDLDVKMKSDDSRRSLLPAGLSAKIVDDAEPPGKPAAPNQELTLALVTAGVLLAGTGGLSGFKKRTASPPAASRRMS